MKVVTLDTSKGKRFIFKCIACGYDHCVDETWGFNKDFESPTFTPSVLYREFEGEKVSRVCHFYVNSGQIQYLSDCTHAYSGKTVPMVDIPEKKL